MPSWMLGGLIAVGLVLVLGLTWGATSGAGIVFVIPPAALVGFGFGATVGWITRRLSGTPARGERPS